MNFSHLTLRARMTLAVSCFVLLLMLVTSTVTIFQFESYNEQHLKEQQAGMLSLLADSIDTAIKMGQTALMNNARAIPKEALSSSVAAQSWLESRTGLNTQFFTSHLFLVEPNGRLLAMTPHKEEHSVSNQIISEIIKHTFSTGRPDISSPAKCCISDGDMQIVFTAPVQVKGQTVLVLAGSFNPLKPNFLSRYINIRFAKSGFNRLLDRQHRIVMHPDSKMFQQQSAEDLVPYIDRAFAEKLTITVRHTGRSGRELLTSLRRISAADWVLASSYYLDEINGPEKTARLWFVSVTVCGTLLALLLAIYMMRFMTRPLAQLADHLSAFSEKQGDDRFIHLPVNGEIGKLTGAFNQMVNEIDTGTEALRQSEQRYRLVLENSTDFIFWRRPDGGFEFVSPASIDVTGFSPDDFYVDPSIMDRMVYSEDTGMFEDSSGRREVSDLCGIREAEYRITTKSGDIRWVRHSCSAIHDSSGKFVGRRGSITDITDKKLLADQVSHLVMHDILTGLPNRTLFSDRLEVALHQAKKDQKLLLVMFFGLDRFKIINDTLGHDAGDSLLIMAAERLRSQVHSEDTICRFGGDVFSFILPSRDSRHEGVSMAYLLLAALTQPFILPGGQQITLTGSIGIAALPTDGNTVEVLIKNAETAMYEAKKSGKNTFRFYTNAMNELAAEMLALDICMPESLARGDFYLHYQPQFEFSSGNICGVEALLRWRHPELGLIGPDRFIPLAEDSGFIIKLGEWVLRTACRDNAAWLKTGFSPMRVAVNISARQFIEPDFIEQISTALAESGLPPELLEIELTESMLVADEEQTLKRLLTLKSMGVQLAIDDFGTGYSSLSYLKHFPLDRLKIDKSFVNDILVDTDDAAITDAIIAMSHALKLKVIAEGVETVSQLAFLKDRGCDEIQGYYISKPLSEKDLLAFLHERRKVG